MKSKISIWVTLYLLFNKINEPYTNTYTQSLTNISFSKHDLHDFYVMYWCCWEFLLDFAAMLAKIFFHGKLLVICKPKFKLSFQNCNILLAHCIWAFSKIANLSYKVTFGDQISNNFLKKVYGIRLYYFLYSICILYVSVIGYTFYY